MSARVRTAVVGVGALGEHHARILSELPESDLVAVVDARAERAAEIAARHNCEALTDFNQLLGRVDAVCLAVPTVLHSEIGCRLLEEGIHVLVEKPIAASLEEADQLIGTAGSHGRVLHVGQSERFNPAVCAVRPYIKKPLFFEAHRLGVFVRRSLDIDVVLDLMIHDLDLILSLVDEPISEVRALGVPILTPRVDIANARIQFAGGCVANITSSRVSNERVRKLRLFQANDYVSIDFHQQEVQMFSLVEGPMIRQREISVERGEPLRNELRVFLAEILQVDAEGLPPGCTGIEGRKALDLALQLISLMPGS